MNVLVVYGTTEGHTRKIAERIGHWIRELSENVLVVDSADLPDELDVKLFDRYILAGSLHMEKHQSSLVHFARANQARLNESRTALISVSLTAIEKDPKSISEANACIGKFIEQTGWIPTTHLCVAGALLFTQYDWLKRQLMRMISEKKNDPTDTEHDHVFTDWTELELFIKDFIAS